MTEDKQITIGSKAIRIDTITGWKFLEAAEVLAKITEELPGVYNKMEEFSQQRMKSTEKVYSRAAALASFTKELNGITDEWWKANGEEMRLPGPRPSIQEQVIFVFPEVLNKARPLVKRLLAVLSVPNNELQQAASGDAGIDALLEQWGNDLIFQGSIGQLIGLLVTAVDAFRKEATEDPEVQALLARAAEMFLGQESPTGSTLTEDDGQPQTETETTDEDDESARKPTSSSDSPTPLDGSPETSSTDLGGAPSDTSGVALTSGG